MLVAKCYMCEKTKVLSEIGWCSTCWQKYLHPPELADPDAWYILTDVAPDADDFIWRDADGRVRPQTT